MRITKLHQIAAASNDLEKSIAFYRDTLGATFIAKFDPPGLAFFDLDGTRLLLEKGAPQATLYFWVDDMSSAYDELVSKGIEFDQKPQVIFRDDNGTFGPPGCEEWMAFFKDPSGNTLALAARKCP